MAEIIEITVPDIGDVSQVEIIEILVKEGDQIDKDTPLITLESDKATMEIPASLAGQVDKLKVKVGDKVSAGDVILTLLGSQQSAKTAKNPVESAAKQESQMAVKPDSGNKTLDVAVPDIGNAKEVEVIEVMVKEGDTITKEQSLITLEGDKATMEIPSPAAGIAVSIKVKVGDKVSQGSLILSLQTEDSALPEGNAPEANAQPVESNKIISTHCYASPAVRRLARELGVMLDSIKGSGRKDRIVKEDIHQFVKTTLAANQSGSSYLPMPERTNIDFSKFGDIESKPLSKVKRLTGVNLHRSWITIPHVTQFDEADITDLEAFRKSEAENALQAGYKLTLLAFVTKVIAKALVVFPQFNSSLDASGEHLIYKQYYNIGIAVDTPNGLVVPVIKQVEQLSVKEIAIEMARLSSKARDKGLSPADMSGGSFTISSLGGISGTAFTPIVNSPEVAILGLSKSVIKPVYLNNEFKPRLMLPLSLSYDHRVIDGAEAARFTRFITENLADIRRILL